ncbi:peptidylprolyl isomerase, partial [Candidatus Aerophobetes bacterium]
SVSDEKDEILDSNIGKEPLVFQVGNHQILPAIEEALRGLDVGDNKQVVLDPHEAYGDVNPQAFKEVHLETIPEDLRYEGALLIISDEHFGDALIRVESIKEERVILDFNHPLAGKRLSFDLKVLDIS